MEELEILEYRPSVVKVGGVSIMTVGNFWWDWEDPVTEFEIKEFTNKAGECWHPAVVYTQRNTI